MALYYKFQIFIYEPTAEDHAFCYIMQHHNIVFVYLSQICAVLSIQCDDKNEMLNETVF